MATVSEECRGLGAGLDGIAALAGEGRLGDAADAAEAVERESASSGYELGALAGDVMARALGGVGCLLERGGVSGEEERGMRGAIARGLARVRSAHDAGDAGGIHGALEALRYAAAAFCERHAPGGAGAPAGRATGKGRGEVRLGRLLEQHATARRRMCEVLGSDPTGRAGLDTLVGLARDYAWPGIDSQELVRGVRDR